jgi:NAD(P)-dependent dehydrogenase (short-subunit alcohol dehydrogenase family)
VDLGLTGKVAIVTGGSEGLGRATAARLAEEGAHVAIVARTAENLEAAAAGIRNRAPGAEVVPITADVSDPGDATRIIERSIDTLGRLDILVNNAGTARALPFLEADDETWQADLDLKLFAAIRLTRLAVPHMRNQGGGRVVNVLATSAKAPGAASVPTSVSRAAGLALTKALSQEFAADRILVNAVLIGLVKSGQWERLAARSESALDELYEGMGAGIPIGRVGDAEELGDLVAFLVSDRAQFITGVGINFDGGSSPVV